MEAIGVDAREVLAVLEKPEVVRQVPGTDRERRNGYGLTVTVIDQVVMSVALDGATRENWEDWARERALFGDGAKVPVLVEQPVPEVVESDLWAASTSPGWSPHFKPRHRRSQPAAAPVRRSHVLDNIHPALRAEIARQVDGDYSRLIVHSPTNVEILPVDED